MAAEIKSYLLGQMPADQFLDHFFPRRLLQKGLASIPKFTEGCYNNVVSCAGETLAYDPFVGHCPFQKITIN